MVQFTADTEQIARAYNLEPQEVILSFALAAGAPAADAFRIITRQKATTTTEQAETTLQSILNNKPALKILINRIKNHQNPVTLKKQDREQIQNMKQDQEGNNLSEEEKNEYKTRSGLIEKIITQVNITSGKEAISGLQTLAKMQGLDKPDEQTEEERCTSPTKSYGSC